MAVDVPTYVILYLDNIQAEQVLNCCVGCSGFVLCYVHLFKDGATSAIFSIL